MTPAILESHCSAWSNDSLEHDTILAFSVLVVNEKGFFDSAYDICIES